MSLLQMLGLVCILLIVSFCTWLVYNLLFHSLSAYPGPVAWRSSRMPFVFSLISGRLPHRIQDFHRKYGPVVRIAPDELSFNEAVAWKDIYLRQTLDRPSEVQGKPPGVEADTFITAPAAVHARLRKPFNPAFSSRATMNYEPCVVHNVNKLMGKLQSQTATCDKIDVVKWLNFMFFDITMDLGWGSSFNCLDNQQYNVWLTFVMTLKEAVIAGALNYVPVLRSIMPLMIPASVKKQVDEIMDVCALKVKARLSQSSSNTEIDVLGLAQKQPGYADLSREEVDQASFVIITAGSETVTSTLSATLNYLLRNADAMNGLVKEVRGTLQRPEDITAQSVSAMPYLNAVLKEGLRLAPPIPANMPRVVPSNGLEIAGRFVPGGTVVSTGCMIQGLSEQNFSRPKEFIPERWLAEGGAQHTSNQSAFNPFSLGARGCLGQPLAWLELRIVLARMLWEFDISVPSGEQLPQWHEQDIFWFWDKKPCLLRLSPATRSAKI